MRIAVIGAGGVGAPFGSALARGGHDVWFVARGAHLKAMQDEGLRVEGTRGNFHLTPTQATDDPAKIGPVDFVFFAPKLWDVETTGNAIKPLVGPQTAVIPIQNGIDAPDRLIPILGKEHVLGGVALIGGAIEKPGLVRQVGMHQKVIFGELDGSRSERGVRFQEACEAAGVECEFTMDIRKALWEKMVFLVALSSVTGITRRNLGVCRADPDIRALILESALETAAVARATGVDIAEEYPHKRVAFIDQQPAETMASMATDLVRGNRLELPWLAGKVVALGKELGVPTPVNRVIYAALKPYIDGTPA